MIVLILLGSIGKSMAKKTNVYISSSAGARWREVRALWLPAQHVGSSTDWGAAAYRQ